mgnify:CR=1 FL=1
MHKKTGEDVRAGESIATLYASHESLLLNAAKTYLEAVIFGKTAPIVVDTILDMVE